MTAMQNLKKAWDENPLAVATVAITALSVVGKIIDAVSAAQGRRAYAKQVNHRIKK